MASYNPPVKGAEYITYISLYGQADNFIVASPTIASGDFKVSTDGNVPTNLDTLPSLDQAGSGDVKVTVSIAEMTGDNIKVNWVDASGAEWWDGWINIQPVASGQQFDQLSTFDASSDTVDVGKISGDVTAANNAESFFDGTGYAGTGNTIPTVTDVSNQVTADITAISGDATAANNAESFFDGTGYAGTGNTIPTVTDVTNQVTADVTAVSGDSGAADKLELDYDGTGYDKANSEIGTVAALTGHTVQTGDNYARIGAPAGASVSADIAALPTAAEIWAYTTRTLTANVGGVTIISAVSGSTISVYENDTWTFTVTDSDLDTDDYENLAFIVKKKASDADTASKVYLRSDTDLIYINGAAPVASANGALTATTTSFTVLIAVAETDFGGGNSWTWYLKGFDTTPTPDKAITLATGVFTVNKPGLQAVT